MKLKDLECILSAEKICLCFGDSINVFTRKDDSEYYEDYYKDDSETNMFEEYGEYEVEQLYDGDYESICIDLKS